MSNHPPTNPSSDDDQDELTAEDLMTLAYLNSLPDENGERPFAPESFEPMDDIEAWRRLIGRGRSQEKTATSPEPSSAQSKDSRHS